MRKFAFLAVLAAALCCAPAWGETYLWSNHISRSFLVEGRSVYDAAQFDYLDLAVEDEDREATQAYLDATGTFTIYGGSYTFWNGTANEAVSGTDKSFPLTALKDEMVLGEKYLGYQPVNDAGDFITFSGAADTGLNDKPIIWEFPTQPELNGRDTVPNFRSTAEQLATYVPYVELTRFGGNVTGFQWRIVNASDTGRALSMSTPSQVRVRVYDHDGNRRYNLSWQNFDANTTLQGTVTFDAPISEADLCYVDARFRPDRAAYASCYTWRFYSRTDNSDAGIASWGELAQTPLKIKQGETAAVTVTMKDNFYFSARERKVFIGDASVLSVSTEDSDSSTATLTLQGLKPGKTTVRILYYEDEKHYSTSTAREVWVTDAEGNVPGSGGGSGGGGGGCDMLVGGLAFLLAIPLLRRRRG